MRLRSLIKEAVYSGAYLVGLPVAGRVLLRGRLVVLTYHTFGDPREHPYLHRLALPSFREQLIHLQRYYNIVSLNNGLHTIGARNTPLTERPMVAITVDDGYSDNYDLMFPIIRELAVPVTVFLATDFLDTGIPPWPTRIKALIHFASAHTLQTPVRLPLGTDLERRRAAATLKAHLSRLPRHQRDLVLAEIEAALAPSCFAPPKPLSWSQVRDMRKSGVEFGSHTCSHSPLDCIPSCDIRHELEDSKRRIEAELGEPCTAIAYPNGNWNEEVIEFARQAGYCCGLTQRPGANRFGDRFLSLRRIQVPSAERIGTFACRVANIAV